MRALIFLFVWTLCLLGCESIPLVFERNTAPSASSYNEPPLVFADGEPIGWQTLGPPLLEATGGQILAEVMLERLANARLSDHGVDIGSEELDAERTIIKERLSNNPDEAERLLREMRQRRGWGTNRFASMLRRNAALRRLVRDDVEVTDAVLRNTYEMAYGPKFEARLIVVKSSAKADSLIKEARRGTSFIDLAIEHSTDASRGQGGLLPMISPLDPTYPKTVRDALRSLIPGQISDPIMLDTGFGILKLDRIIDRQAVCFDDVKHELEPDVRRHGEKIAMQKLARQLLAKAKVRVFDRALHESWRRHMAQIMGN